MLAELDPLTVRFIIGAVMVAACVGWMCLVRWL